MGDNLSIAIDVDPLRFLTLLSVDEILLPTYMKGPTNFRGLLFNVEMSPFSLKRMIFVLFEFM